MSHSIASNVLIISRIDSPLSVEELAISILIKSADNLFEASSNVVLVLVLGSKNKLAIVLPSKSLNLLLSLLI